MEAPAFDRRTLDDRAIRCLEAIDSSGQESLNGRRNNNRSVAGVGVGIQRQQLFDEQRVAFGGLGNSSTRSRWEVRRSPASPISVLASLSEIGCSETTNAFCRGTAHEGRASKSSARARHTSRIGAPEAKPVMYSSRSSSVGSAQCRSSTTTISGRSRASPSSSLRNAQQMSAGDPGESPLPTAAAILSHTTSAFSRTNAATAALRSCPPISFTISASGQYGDSFAVRKTPTADDASTLCQ